MRATELFRGAASGEVEVWTGLGGGDCGYVFTVGATYLVYADRGGPNQVMTTGICSRTQPLSGATEDLQYLRSLAQSTASLGRIFGTAMKINDAAAGPGDRRVPYAGARVIAEGNSRKYEARSAADGTYEIPVPAGTYTLRVELPDGLYALYATRVTLADARGCATNPIGVYSDGRVSGRLVTASREPVPAFGLELIPVSSATAPNFYPSFQIRSDAHGLFEFSRVPPGVYHVGYDTRRDKGTDVVGPRVLLASGDGAPRTIEIVLGGRVKLEDLPLPAGVKLARVSGVVTDQAGGLVAGARVYVQHGGSEFALIGPGATTERDGRFGMTIIADRLYRLVAEGYDADGRYVFRAEGPVFTATADVSSATLVLRPIR
jgi:hypothetical protein